VHLPGRLITLIKRAKSSQSSRVTIGPHEIFDNSDRVIAWDFVVTEKPNFDIVTLTPPMVYGPLRHSITSVKDLNESNARIYNLFINSKKDAELPPNGMPVYTDVRVS
jgi:hypothetical protein